MKKVGVAVVGTGFWGKNVAIQNFADDIILITLPALPHQNDELETVNEMLCDYVDKHVIIDFTEVKMLTSETICTLMILDKLLRGSECMLVLYSLSSEIRQIFKRTGLESVFEFADDELSALHTIRHTCHIHAEA